MSDKAKSSADAGDDKSDDKSKDSNKDNEPDYKALYETSKAEIEKIVSQRQELKKRLKELEDSRGDEERERAKKAGDVDAVNKGWQEKYDKDTGDLQAELKTEREKFHREVTQSRFKDLVTDKVTIKPGQFLAVIQAEGYSIDTQEGSDGELELVVKTPKGDARKDVAKFVDEFLAENSHLAKNPRQKGTDSKKADGTPGVELTVADLNKMSSQEQAEYFRQDPAAAKKVLSGVRLGAQ